MSSDLLAAPGAVGFQIMLSCAFPASWEADLSAYGPLRPRCRSKQREDSLVEVAQKPRSQVPSLMKGRAGPRNEIPHAAIYPEWDKLVFWPMWLQIPMRITGRLKDAELLKGTESGFGSQVDKMCSEHLQTQGGIFFFFGGHLYASLYHSLGSIFTHFFPFCKKILYPFYG